jgi:hypothetical protein
MKHIATLLTIFLSVPALAQQTYIQCGRLIDGKSNSVQTEMTIIVESNKIIDVSFNLSYTAYNSFKQ